MAYEGHLSTFPTQQAYSGISLIPSGGGNVVKYETIAAALADSSSGDVVQLGPGTYNEDISVPAGVKLISGTLISPTIIQGQGTAATVTLGSNATIQDIRVNADTGFSAIHAPNTSTNIFLNRVVVQVATGAAGVLLEQTGAAAINQLSFNSGSAAVTGLDARGTVRCLDGGINFNDGSLTDGIQINDAIIWSGPGVIDYGPAMTITGNAFSFESGSTGASVETQIITPEDGGSIANVLSIKVDGIRFNQNGGRIHGTTSDLLVASGLNGANTELILSNTEYRQERVSNASGLAWIDGLAKGIFTFNDSAIFDDPTFRIGGELAVGAALRSAESIFGEGDSTTQFMYVFTDDGTGTSFSDITEACKSTSGSIATLFQGTSAGNILYIGNEFRKFPGLNSIVTTATDLGSGALTYSYSDGTDPSTGWVEFNIMCRENSGAGESFGQMFLCDTGDRKTNFGDISEGDDWDIETINGQDAYWIKIEIDSAITTIPQVERIKLQVNSCQIDNTGIQRHGSNRPYKTLISHQRLTDDLSGASPGNKSLAISTGITITPIDNQYNNNTLDGTGGIITVPSGLDTSSPLTFRWGWVPLGSGSGTVNFEVIIAEPIEVGVNIDAGTVPETTISTGTTFRPSGSTQTNAVPTVETTTTDLLYISEFEVNIPNLQPGSSFAWALQRDDAGNTDGFSSSVAIAYLQIEGRFWQS